MTEQPKDAPAPNYPHQTRDEERVLFQSSSPFQEIILAQEPNGHLNLTLDDVWQFRSQDEYIFHEVLADTPMMMATRPAQVLILGGGDGLALRNVLRYAAVEAVTLVELDPDVLELTRAVAEMVELSENSLADPRVEVITGDAVAYLRARALDLAAFDVVICDFPAATCPELESLFSPDFYASLLAVTHAQSLIAVQVSQDPEGFWQVCSAIEGSFAWLHPMLVNLNLDGADEHDWADFVIASPSPQSTLREPPERVRFLTRELVPRLRIANRSGELFETLEYGLA